MRNTKKSREFSVNARWQFRQLGRAAQCAVEALEQRVLMSVDVTTYHYDQSESGGNTNETILNPSNVNVSTFGKIASLPTDGQVYAQPLIMTGVPIPGGGTEDLVLVATENDSVYAFNAEGTSTTPVWKTSLLQSGEQPIPASATGSNSIAPTVGITGTPVIDPDTGTLYCVGSFEESNGTYQQRLYALNIATGATIGGGSVIIAATVDGTGAGSSGGTVAFDPLIESQCAALTLDEGNVYVAFGSHGNQGNFHGWVMAYDATTLVQDYVWCDTPNGAGGGISMSGGGLATDSSGNLYATSGNGTFDPNVGGSDYAMALVKLSPSLVVQDYFSPYNEATLSSQSSDYGAGNAVLLPNQSGTAPDEVLTAGQWGGIFLNNSDTGSMGEFTANGPNADLGEASTLGSQHNTFSYWNGAVYIGGDGAKLKAFPVANGALAPTPSSQSSFLFGQYGGNGQGSSPTESSNGTSNGIVWVVDNNAYVNGYTGSGSQIVMAYNANNLRQLLWTSNEAANGRDKAGTAIQSTTPVVANGYVYVGSGTGLTIYGNIPFTPPPPVPPPPPPLPPGAIVGFNNFTLNGADGNGIDGSARQSNNFGAAPTLTSDENGLTLTTSALSESSSAFYDMPVGYANFTASFTYTDTQPGGYDNGPADGITFTLQDDSRGVHALGGAGGYLGYGNGSTIFPATPIVPSFAAAFQVYRGSTTADSVGGFFGQEISTGNVDMASGDPINILLTYNSSKQALTETLSDPKTYSTYTRTYTNIDLASLLGSSTAYIGFTGATGAADSLQTVSNFSYFADPPQQVNLASYAGTYGIGISGQATINGGYDGAGNALSTTPFGSALAISTAKPPQTFYFGAGNTPNTIAAAGQTIALPQGQYGNISMVGSAVNGSQTSQSIIVNYADGSGQTYTQSFSDWHSPKNYAGEVNAVVTGSEITSTGGTWSIPTDVYEYTFPTNPALTVASITLPNNPNLRVLAINVNVAPTVTSVSPYLGPTAGGTSVTITGGGFTGATAVNFGSKPASSFTVYDDGSITAVAPAGSGAVDVTVTTPAGKSLITPADQFTYGKTAAIPALAGSPVINGDNPNGLFTAAGQNTNGQQRSMVEDVVYTFNEPVMINNANQAFTVSVLNGSSGVVPSALSANAVPGSNGTEWAVSLTGQPNGMFGSIANGQYSISINPSFVFAAADGTTAMTGGQTDTFYRLYGDINGDEVVNATDNFQFKAALTTYNPAFDSNGDGAVNASDNFQFKKSLIVSYAGFAPTI